MVTCPKRHKRQRYRINIKLTHKSGQKHQRRRKTGQRKTDINRPDLPDSVAKVPPSKAPAPQIIDAIAETKPISNFLAPKLATINDNKGGVITKSE